MAVHAGKLSCFYKKGRLKIEEKTYKIYKYTNLLNNKVYIGRTKTSLVGRAGKNGEKYHNLKYFGAAIKKYGWENFKGEIILDNLTYEEACEQEKYYIKFYDSQNSKKGYNLASGGEGPTKEALEKMKESHRNKSLSEEHKAKISKSLGQGKNNVNYGRKQSALARLHIQMAKSGRNHPNWGKHLSEETKEKIREGNEKPVLQYDLDGTFIREWSGAKRAAKELDLNYTAINNCLRCIRHSSCGYIWIYKNKEDREKYADNKYILENFGINYIPKKEESLKENNN